MAGMSATRDDDLTVDELARRAGIPTSTVRLYQARGLLPGPRREGRVGYYGAGHLARLRLIAELQQRGFSLAGIKQLVDAWEQGRSLDDLLGLEAEATAPLAAPEPVRLPVAELAGRFAGQEPGPAVLARAAELGLLRVEGDVVACDARFLAFGTELAALGIPLDTILDEAAVRRRRHATRADRRADRRPRPPRPAGRGRGGRLPAAGAAGRRLGVRGRAGQGARPDGRGTAGRAGVTRGRPPAGPVPAPAASGVLDRQDGLLEGRRLGAVDAGRADGAVGIELEAVQAAEADGHARVGVAAPVAPQPGLGEDRELAVAFGKVALERHHGRVALHGNATAALEELDREPLLQGAHGQVGREVHEEVGGAPQPSLGHGGHADTWDGVDRGHLEQALRVTVRGWRELAGRPVSGRPAGQGAGDRADGVDDAAHRVA